MKNRIALSKKLRPLTHTQLSNVRGGGDVVVIDGGMEANGIGTSPSEPRQDFPATFPGRISLDS